MIGDLKNLMGHILYCIVLIIMMTTRNMLSGQFALARVSSCRLFQGEK